MEKGRIIFLNGVTSAGKTSIVDMVPEFAVPNDVKDAGIYEEQLCWENVLLQLKFFFDKGCKNIVSLDFDDYGNDSYSIMQNGGKCCDYGHVHYHIFSRYDNDGFGWLYPEGESEYSKSIAEKLKEDI